MHIINLKLSKYTYFSEKYGFVSETLFFDREIDFKKK